MKKELILTHRTGILPHFPLINTESVREATPSGSEFKGLE